MTAEARSSFIHALEQSQNFYKQCGGNQSKFVGKQHKKEPMKICLANGHQKGLIKIYLTMFWDEEKMHHILTITRVHKNKLAVQILNMLSPRHRKMSVDELIHSSREWRFVKILMPTRQWMTMVIHHRYSSNQFTHIKSEEHGVDKLRRKKKDSRIMGIEAFEMWCYLRMTSTYWIQKVTNEQALINILEQERLSKRYRRLSWFRNILRHETPGRVLEDKI